MADSVTATELRKLTAKQLAERLDDAKAELFNLRFQLATNQLDNTARLTHVKKDVARILTVMRQQEIEAWEASQDQTADGGRQTAAEPPPAVDAEAETIAETAETAVEEPEKKRRLRRGR
jgi:large subunit ribosomal protein L29